MVKEKIRKKHAQADISDDIKSLILHNDDVNHFGFVVISLIEICGHGSEQAEQCALIAHLKGNCVVKKGTLKDLMTCHKLLTLRNLSVSIE